VVTQEQVVHFPTRAPGVEWPSFIHWAAAGGTAKYGLRTPGEGVKVGGHHEGAVTHPDERGWELHPDRLAEVVAYVDRWLPGLDPQPRAGTTCLYTTTPSEDFLLDRIGPLVVGSACSGHGFKFAPLVGRTLAALATEAAQL
jgi:sarcosine oxidase